MIQELYINSVLMDVDEKFNVALLYDSMLFTDIEKLMSNRSTGFSLPKTANNLRAIEHAELSDIQDDPSVEILYPRRNHKVDYYQNGVPIVTNALGVMLDISDRINFVFIFGNMENTRHLEKKLSELPEGDDSFVPWNNSSSVFVFGQNDLKPCFAYMDYGRGLGPTGGDSNRYHHPVVPARWIIQKIAAANGLTIDQELHFNDIFIPLVTKNSSDSINKEIGVNGSFRLLRVGGVWIITPYQVSGTPDPKLYPAVYDTFPFRGGRYDRYDEPVRIVLNDGKPFEITLDKEGAEDSFDLYIMLRTGASYMLTSVSGGVVQDNPTRITKRFTIDMSIDMSDIFDWAIRISPTRYLATGFHDLILPDCHVWRDLEEAEFNGRFPVIPNLPDMKQVEFLKYMMQLRGLFAYPKGLNRIGFVFAEVLIANKPNALDWTDKLITDSPIPNAPESIDFKMSNFAQTNWFRWDNDDEVRRLNTDAALMVYNETIEREREALKLPFSGSKNTPIGDEENGRLIASIPLYDSDGKMAKLKQRVLTRQSTNDNRLEVAFTNLDFNTILSVHYAGYRRIVEHPRVLTVRVKLTDIDLSGLDLTRPVYFEQFGRHYAILSVQAQTDGLCKCKLLEI